MKKIAILNNYNRVFDLSAGRLASYQELTNTFRKHGIDLRRVSMHSLDMETGIFRDYVDMDPSGQFQVFNEPYKPDIIWNRSSDGQLYIFASLEKVGISVFPSSRIISIASDKYETYLLLKKHQPYSVLLSSFFTDALCRENLSDRVVLKPIRASSGKGISFPTQAELLLAKTQYEGLESLFIVQEFIDFSGGIPGLVEGIHDVRLVFIGGKFSHSTLRIPAKGGLKSNIGSGGSEVHIDKERIPNELHALADLVTQSLLIEKDNILSIDFGYCLSQKRWYVFEVNYSPGILFDAQNKVSRDHFIHGYYTNLAEYFLSLDNV